MMHIIAKPGARSFRSLLIRRARRAEGDRSARFLLTDGRQEDSCMLPFVPLLQLKPITTYLLLDETLYWTFPFWEWHNYLSGRL